MDDDAGQSQSNTSDEHRSLRRLPIPDFLIPRPRVSGEALDTADETVAAVDSRTSRATWITVLTAFVVTLAVPLIALAAVTDDPPEMRVFQTDGLSQTDVRVSALVADGSVRVLILNSTDPRSARSTLGEARPWEPSPQLIIAPSDDDAATGLLAVVQAAAPQTVIVAGVPGADPIWHALESECRQRGIDLEYTAGSMRVDVGRLELTVFGGEEDPKIGRAVVVRRTDGGATVVLALDRGTPTLAAHALVTSSSGDDATADLVITTDANARRVSHAEVVLDYQERARIVLEQHEIKVFGGTHRAPPGADDREDEQP